MFCRFLFRKWKEVHQTTSGVPTDAGSVVSEMHTEADETTEVKPADSKEEIVPGVQPDKVEVWPGQEEEGNTAGQGDNNGSGELEEAEIPDSDSDQESGDEEQETKPRKPKGKAEPQNIEAKDDDGLMENDTNNLASGTVMETIVEE